MSTAKYNRAPQDDDEHELNAPHTDSALTAAGADDTHRALELSASEDLDDLHDVDHLDHTIDNSSSAGVDGIGIGIGSESDFAARGRRNARALHTPEAPPVHARRGERPEEPPAWSDSDRTFDTDGDSDGGFDDVTITPAVYEVPIGPATTRRVCCKLCTVRHHNSAAH